MSSCTWLSDRMPAVALGQAEWTADEIGHLSGCSACQREWELLGATTRLADHWAAGFDPDSVSQGLVQRLVRETRRRERKAWGFGGMAAAAALAGLLLSDRTDPSRLEPHSRPIVAGLQIPLPELDDLQPAELDSVLRTMDQPAPDADTLEMTGPGTVDPPELETVLDYWEG